MEKVKLYRHNGDWVCEHCVREENKYAEFFDHEDDIDYAYPEDWYREAHEKDFYVLVKWGRCNREEECMGLEENE